MKKSILKQLAILIVFVFSNAAISQNPVPELKYLINQKASSLDYNLESKGYSFIKIEKTNTSAYQNWYNSKRSKCITVMISDGRIQSIVDSPGYDCGITNDSYGNNQNNSGQGITVYKDSNFKGQSYELRAGNYTANELGVGNDQISSIKIPNGFSVSVFTDNNFGGSSKTYTSNVNSMGDFNDKISSMQISKIYNNNNSKNNNSKSVVFYKDGNFKGQSASLGLGYHDYNDLGVGNDQISSIRIPYGYKVTVYADSNYNGKSRTYTNDVSNLADFNDKISSVLITKN